MEVKFPQLFQWVGLNQDELQVKNRNEAFFSFYKLKKFLELNFFVHFRQQQIIAHGVYTWKGTPRKHYRVVWFSKKLGNCEEQLPSTESLPTVGSWLTLKRQTTDNKTSDRW